VVDRVQGTAIIINHPGNGRGLEKEALEALGDRKGWGRQFRKEQEPVVVLHRRSWGERPLGKRGGGAIKRGGRGSEKIDILGGPPRGGGVEKSRFEAVL